MKQIHLRLSERPRSYTIRIHEGLLQRLPELLLQRWKGSSVFIVTDDNVEKLYGRNVLRQCVDGGLNASLFFFSAGERSKNFKTLHALQTALLEIGIRRDSVIVALGGGVVGDIAGFVAATILRGVKFVHVPTTLLAQVDSSIGGKVGIDHPLGKNLIGAFHQPAAVFIDPNVLRTLPAKEFRNGLAEVVKIAAALDAKFFAHLENNAGNISQENSELIAEIIRRAVGLKAAVVAKDEREASLRKALNVGHTIGHALEAATNYTLDHGDAVAIGMAVESKIAMQLGLLAERDYNRIIRLLKSLKLPTRFRSLKKQSKFVAALAADKKSERGAMRLSLLAGVGRTAIGVAVSKTLIEQILSFRRRKQ